MVPDQSEQGDPTADPMRQPNTPTRMHTHPSRVLLLVLGVIAGLTIIGERILAQHFSERGVFDQYNVLFDADPNTRLQLLAHGWGDPNYLHPGVPVVSLGSRLVVATIGTVRPDMDQRRVREDLALWFVPLAGGIATVAVGLLFFWMGAGVAEVAVLTVLTRAFFSNVLFAAIPDHFGLSAVPLCALLALFVRSTARREHGPMVAWCILAVLAAGITVTNLGVALSLFGLAGIVARTPIRTVLIRSIAIGAVAGSLTLVAYVGTSKLYGFEPFPENKLVEEFATDPSAAYLTSRLPAALVNTIVPPSPRTVANRLGLLEEARYSAMFTLEPMDNWWLLVPSSIVLTLWLGAGIVLGVARWKSYGIVMLGAVTVLLFNGVLHASFGPELFLYSQHWAPALALLLGIPILAIRPKGLRFGILVIGAGLVVASNTARVSELLDVLNRM